MKPALLAALALTAILLAGHAAADHPADTDSNGWIIMEELVDFINLWYGDSTAADITEVAVALDIWKNPPPEVSFDKPWGKIVFDSNGRLTNLQLKYGSYQNVLSDTWTGVFYDASSGHFSDLYDTSPEMTLKNNTVIAIGQLMKSGGEALSQGTYKKTWTIRDGYIILDYSIELESPAGTLKYRFPFNSSVLKEYWHSRWLPQPLSVSTRESPLDGFKSEGMTMVDEGNENIIGRSITLINDETESVTIASQKGSFDKMSLQIDDNRGIIRYITDMSENPRSENRAVFYIMTSPKEVTRQMKRIKYTNHEQIQDEDYIDESSEKGYKYIVILYWQQQATKEELAEAVRGFSKLEKTLQNLDNKHMSVQKQWYNSFGSAIPRDESIEDFIEEAHQKGVKVLLYMGLANEAWVTDWYKENLIEGEAGQHRTPYNYGGYEEDYLGEFPRSAICTNSPYFDHILSDVDRITDEYNADGIFVDWFEVIPCEEDGIAGNNIQQLIDLIEYVHQKGRMIFIHASEENRIPFLDNLADSVAMGERAWSECDYDTTESGIFGRWTRSTGQVGILLNASDVDKAQLEVRSALAEGINPFGALRPEMNEDTNSYAESILAQISDYPVESMELYAANEEAAYSNSKGMVVVSVLKGETHSLLFAINKNQDARTVYIGVDNDILGFGGDISVFSVSDDEFIGEFDPDEISDPINEKGIHITVPGNGIKIIRLSCAGKQ